MISQSLSGWLAIGLLILFSGVVEAGEIQINTGRVRVEKGTTGNITVETGEWRRRNELKRSFYPHDSFVNPYYPYDNVNHCQMRSHQDVQSSDRNGRYQHHHLNISQRCS